MGLGDGGLRDQGGGGDGDGGIFADPDGDGVYEQSEGDGVDVPSALIGGRRLYLQPGEPADPAIGDVWLPSVEDISPVGDPIRWWPMDEGTGTTTTEYITKTDANTNGVAWVEDAGYEGGWALEGSGTDYIDTNDTLGTFGSSLDTDYAVAFTIKTTSSNELLGAGVGGDDFVWLVKLDGTYQGTAGRVTWVSRDSSGGTNSVDSGTDLTDDAAHRVVLNKTGNAGADWGIWVDGVYDDPTVNQDTFDETAAMDFDQTLKVFANAGGSSVGSHLADDLIFYDRSLTQTEIENDYARMGWA